MKNFYLIGSILLTFIFNIQSQSLQFKYAEIPLGQITPTNWLKQQSDI